MSLVFTYEPEIDNQLLPNSNNVYNLSVKSSFFTPPLVSFIIFNILCIKNSRDISIEGTIIVTDGPFNNIGTITFYNYTFFNPLKTSQGTATFPITLATGIFSSYTNGSIIIDASWTETNTLYVFTS